MEMKKKKVPTRQCLGCSEHRPKNEFLRVVRAPDGTVSLDFTGKKSGRGAYLCPKADCLKKARKSKALDRSLEVPIPEEVYDRLEREIEVAHNG